MFRDDTISRWLLRLLLVLLVILTSGLCFLIWRLCVVTIRVERTLANVSQSVGEATDVAGRLVAQVDGLAGRLDDIERNIKRLPVNAALSLAEDYLRKDGADGVSDSETSSVWDEIHAILARFGESGLECEYEGKRRSAAWVATKLRAKAWLLSAEIASAEDFIEKVATQTHNGDPYTVVQTDGPPRPLAEWMAEVLADQRKTSTPPSDS